MVHNKILTLINDFINTLSTLLGEYELKLDVATRSLVGFKKGQPANWRRATFLRPLNGVDSAANVPAHDHAHTHNESCSH